MSVHELWPLGEKLSKDLGACVLTFVRRVQVFMVCGSDNETAQTAINKRDMEWLLEIFVTDDFQLYTSDRAE